MMSFVGMPALVGPMLGPIAGGLIVAYLHWRLIFFRQCPDWTGRAMDGLSATCLTIKRREDSASGCWGLILFGSGIALLSYVLEIFGEHLLSAREVFGLLALSFALIGGYGLHASRTRFPLLQLALFRIRSFSAAVSGSFSRASASAACRSSCRCSTRLVSATARSSRAC